MITLSFITRVGKYFTDNMVPKNYEHQQNANMDLGFGNPEDNLVNSANTEFMPDIENTQVITYNDSNARIIMRILNGLSSQKLIKGDYATNRMLIIRHIIRFINGVYDSNKNKEYSRGTIFALLALRGAIPKFEELITPPIKNNNGVLAKFEKIMQNVDPKYIQEWNDQTNERVISNFGFGQQYDLSEIRKKCREIKYSLRPYLTKADPYQIKRENQPHVTENKPCQLKRKNQFRLSSIIEEHSNYDYDEFSYGDGESKESQI